MSRASLDEQAKLTGAYATHYHCDLTLLDTVLRERRAKLAAEVWPQILETKELAIGYEFRFDFNPTLYSLIAELATLEHLCCPFFDIGLKLDKNNGPIWLQITGDAGVKQFIQAELNL